MKTQAIILIFLVVAVSAYGQEAPPAPDGAIEEAQVIIEKDREIILPLANRYFEKINLEQNQVKPDELEFNFKERSFDPGRIDVTFTPATYEATDVSNGDQSRLKLGYGNYASPLVQADIYTTTNNAWLLGADLDHLSFGSGVVDDENSAAGRSSLNLIASSLKEGSSFNGRLGYRSRTGFFYGYPDEAIVSDRDSIKQVINEFNAAMDWSAQLTNEGAFKLLADLNLTNDEYGVSENLITLGGTADLPVSDLLSLRLTANANFSQYTNAIAEYSRNVYEIDPSVIYSNDNLSVRAGVKLALISEDSSLNENFNVYPDVHLNYGLSDNLRAYAIIEGGLRKHFYASRSNENFHITDSANIQHASETYRGTIGLSTYGPRFSADFFARYSQTENMGFFVNRPDNPSEFDLVYDEGSTGVLSLGTSMSYTINEHFYAELGVSYYSYSTDLQPAAYHLPEVEAFVNIRSQLTEQWSLVVGGQFMGGIIATDLSEHSDFDLDAFLDLSVELAYQINGKWGSFLCADNVLNTDYSRYWRYPNRQIMAKIGVIYSF